MSKALFLDRDGIINIDHGYVHKIEDFEFVDGIFELCKRAIDKGYQIFVITNQAGIARGMYDIPTFEKLSKWMVAAFAEQNIEISKVYFCPHHPLKGVNEFVMSCQCRKPEPGMIIQAQQEFGVNLAKSIFIGDKLSDMQAADNAGIDCKILMNSRYVDKQVAEQIAGTIEIQSLTEALAYVI